MVDFVSLCSRTNVSYKREVDKSKDVIVEIHIVMVGNEHEIFLSIIYERNWGVHVHVFEVHFKIDLLVKQKNVEVKDD